jgi:hypothetical protein
VSPEEERIRGNKAQRVLADDLYIEAFSSVRERIVSQLSQAETTGDKRQRLNDLLVALSTVNRYLEQVMTGGKMAAQEIERQRTLKERVLGL